MGLMLSSNVKMNSIDGCDGDSFELSQHQGVGVISDSGVNVNNSANVTFNAINLN